MSLLQKLKSALGLNGTGSSEPTRSGDVDVTVEREPSTEAEDAVKGTETASSEVVPEEPETGGDSGDDESEGPSADEFESLTAEAEADAAEEIDEAEPGETASEPDGAEMDETVPEPDEGEPGDTATEEAATADEEAAPPTEPEPDSETADAEAAADAAETAEGSTDPVTELKGIGTAYGDLLAGVGIETVGELAAADPADVAEETDLGEKRVAGWIEQANEY